MRIPVIFCSLLLPIRRRKMSQQRTSYDSPFFFFFSSQILYIFFPHYIPSHFFKKFGNPSPEKYLLLPYIRSQERDREINETFSICRVYPQSTSLFFPLSAINIFTTALSMTSDRVEPHCEFGPETPLSSALQVFCFSSPPV